VAPTGSTPGVTAAAAAPGPALGAATPGLERIPPLVGAAWALLIINTLGSTGAVTVIPIPRSVIQMVTMGSLLVALALALALNPRIQLRPSAFLLLLTMLLVVSIISSAALESGFGAVFRCGRFAVFIATLWLLTRWWNGAFTLVRHHIRTLGVVLLSTAVGLVIAPGLAMPEIYGGRLVDAIWPLTPPQVGLFAAIVIGLTLMLWLGGLTDRRSAVFIVVPSIVLLMLTHTRTATIGLLIGLTVAIGSLVLTNGRARRVFAWSMLIVGLTAVLAGPLLQTWFRRGQSQENISNLTGRAKVWDALLAEPRTAFEQLFGVGLTNKSFAGLPIDSSWLAVYHEQGYVGIVIVASFLSILIVVAALRPPSLARACAIFLIVYTLSASFTEAGLGDAAPYLLNLTLAAALLSRSEPAQATEVAPAPARVTA
jgi:hypothetical protein